MKSKVLIAYAITITGLSLLGEVTNNQASLERYLLESVSYCGTEDGPYVPHRYRNALEDCRDFLQQGGWTTNMFIAGLMVAMTNNLADSNWTNEEKRTLAKVAAWRLKEIDNPAVTNFFRYFNEIDGTFKLKDDTIPGMFYYTDLETEVLKYMRTLCIKTNIYANVAFGVAYDMSKALETMSPPLRSSATNRVAQYMYFSITHTDRRVIAQDRLLASFLPVYSNSFQRLAAMRYVQSTVTNARTRVLAQQEVDRLSSVPTNQLNDIGWIAEDL